MGHTYDDVARAWATRADKIKATPRVFYEDDVIYSYGRHFPIARLDDTCARMPTPVCWFNARRYSVSTSNHQRIVRRAAERAGWRIIELHAPDHSLSWPGGINPGGINASAEIDYRLVEVRELLKKADRARIHKRWPAERARAIFDEVVEFARLMGQPLTAQRADEVELEIFIRRAQAEFAKAA